MQRLLDVYTIQAGDVAVAYAGRGYNANPGRWQTVSGINMVASSWQTARHLVDADFLIQTAAGALKCGVVIAAFIVHDPTNTSLTTPWFMGVTSKAHFVHWHGRLPLDCGFLWRVHQGGLIAGDVVTMGVGYE